MDSEVARENKENPGRLPLRRRLLSTSLSLLAALVVAGCVLTALRLSDKTRAAPPPAAAAAAGQCSPVAGGAGRPVSSHLGAWRYELTAAGTFYDLIPGPRERLVALQACGREETSLRLSLLSSAGRLLSSSRQFPRAAPLASSAAVSGRSIWLGTGVLAFDKAAAEAPYRLYCYLLDSKLSVLRRLSLGRGYGLELAAGPAGSAIASTGRAIIRISARGQAERVAAFPGEVVQHMALLPGGRQLLLSLFRPGAVPPVSSSSLALLDLANGHISSRLPLPAGEEVGSLVPARAGALLVLGDGTSQHLARLARLAPLTLSAEGSSTTSLASLALLPVGGPVILAGLSGLTCVSPSGHLGPTTRPQGGMEVPTAMAMSRRSAYAITPAGIGRLALPEGC